MEHDHANKHYLHLMIMAGFSFLAMYALMYAMVNSWANVYPSFNQFYMAGLMTAPMIVIELVVMRSMYNNKKLNAVILIGSILAGILFFSAIRHQTAISDEQFLKSMIPHHAGAILMCNEAPAKDQEIQGLCKNILSSQQAEIDQMKAMLIRINR